MIRLLADFAPADPAAGLALEEALIESVTRGGEDSLRLWVNRRAVVIGRSQSAAAEVDLQRANALAIPVLRRASGGGTVYHHPGNLNVSLFLFDGRALGGVEQTFVRLGEGLAGRLSALGLAVRAAGNSLFIGERKVGGAAQARRRTSLLYHTTLLVERDSVPMEALLLALRPGYRPRGVASHPRPVTAIAEEARRRVDGRAVGELAAAAIAETLRRPLRDGKADASETARAAVLEDAKYRSDAWNLSR